MSELDGRDLGTGSVAQPRPLVHAIDRAGQQLRAPWAASLAGVLFAVMFTAAMLIARSDPLLTATDAQIAQIFAQGQDKLQIIGGLYLAPFAGIMFLWFLAVVRDQIGEHEDRFFATGFFGSGVLFVGLLFTASGIASATLVSVEYLHQPPPSAQVVGLLRALSYTILFVFSTRAAAVFLISMASIGMRSHAFPRWVALTGYVVGLVLLVGISFYDWIILLLPAWVAVVSISTLRRERRRHLADVEHAHGGMPV